MKEADKIKFLAAFGERVRRIRRERDMTLEELARACGYTANNCRSSMSGIETGKTDIGISKLIDLAKALGVSEGYLLGFEDRSGAIINAPMDYQNLDDCDKLRVGGIIQGLLMADKYKKEDQKVG